MFKKLFYVSFLLATISSHLLAMDERDKLSTSILTRSLIDSAPEKGQHVAHSLCKTLSLSMEKSTDAIAYHRAGSMYATPGSKIFFRNRVPGLTTFSDSIIINDTVRFPYLINPPYGQNATNPSYLSNLKLHVYVNDSLHVKTDLPLTAKYKEMGTLPCSTNFCLNAVLTGEAYSQGTIEDGEWKPQGEPEYISVSLFFKKDEKGDSLPSNLFYLTLSNDEMLKPQKSQEGLKSPLGS